MTYSYQENAEAGNMTDTYLLMDIGVALAEFATSEETWELQKFMEAWHPDRNYEILEDI
jgi:hypothetical protein